MAARLDQYLKLAVQKHASDVHFSSGMPVSMRVDGDLVRVDEAPHDASTLQNLLFEILDETEREKFLKHKNLDKSYRVADLGNFRVNVFLSYNGIAAVFRWIPAQVPSMEEVGLPASLIPVIEAGKGLVLVTGPTGSGKSTTLASMIDHLNRYQPDHILTVEDPIEFVHVSKKSLVSQREIGSHCESFADALKYSLREDPDVILVGEMRDLETISLAMTAAETGHLVFGTLHTRGAAASVDRIIDSFPANQQAMIRTMLAESLRAVVSQSLLKRADGQGRVAAFEIMIMNHAVSNLIREGKTFQIGSVMQTGRNLGMQLMDHHILELIRQGVVRSEDAEAYISDAAMLPNRPKRPAVRNNLGAGPKPSPYGRQNKPAVGKAPVAPARVGGPPPMPAGAPSRPGGVTARPAAVPPMPARPGAVKKAQPPRSPLPRAGGMPPGSPAPVSSAPVPSPAGGLPPSGLPPASPLPPTPAEVPDDLYADADSESGHDVPPVPEAFDLDGSGGDNSDFEVTGLDELTTGDVSLPDPGESPEETPFKAVPQVPSQEPWSDSGDDFGTSETEPPAILTSYEADEVSDNEPPPPSVPSFSQMPGMGENPPPPPNSPPPPPARVPNQSVAAAENQEENDRTVLADHRMGLPPPPGSLFRKKKSG
ncbi:MAG: PilT/PilU family type 4a pilus ATPase [Bdellovibrionales bacterium]|nr:PilT/PilU family type 4a pilus ATPase [Bdellovibrionales bacterium]